MTATVRIRPAERADVSLLFSLIVELAVYEQAAAQVAGNEELLEHALFSDQPAADAVIAEVDGTAAGFALFHGTFSTWDCRPGLWLEDLYVKPEYRRFGVGQALISHLARETLERRGTRLQWSALHWNQLALGFYDKLAAERLHEWQMLRLTGSALVKAADATRLPS